MTMLVADLSRLQRIDMLASGGGGAPGASVDKKLVRGAYELRTNEVAAGIVVKQGVKGDALAVTDLTVFGGERLQFVLHRDETLLFASLGAACQAWVIPLVDLDRL